MENSSTINQNHPAEAGFFRSIVIYLATFRPYNVVLFLTFPLMCLGPISLALRGRDVTAGLAASAGLCVLGLYLILIATFMLNDVTDRRIDEVAHPERPIPSGKVDAGQIGAASLASYLLAHLIAALINRWVLLMSVTISAIGYVHFRYTKRRIQIPGSSEVITPLTWACMPAYCFMSVENYDAVTIGLLSIFIYCADVAHDTMGGACDIAGDELGNVRTYASVHGRKSALWVSLLFFIMSGLAGLVLFFFAQLGYVYLTAMSGVLILVALAYVSTFVNSDGPNFAARLRINHSLIGNYFVAGFSFLFVDFLAAALFEWSGRT